MEAITNTKILDFYSQNPSINFEAVNLIFVELLEKLINNMSNTLNENLSIDMLKEISANVSQHSLLLKTIDERTRDNLSSIKSNTELVLISLTRLSSRCLGRSSTGQFSNLRPTWQESKRSIGLLLTVQSMHCLVVP